MKRFIPTFIAFALFSFQFANAQTFADPLSKDLVEDCFVREMQRQSFSFNEAYHQILTDSLAVISCDATGRNGFGQTVIVPIIFYRVLFHVNEEQHSFTGVYLVKDNGITPPLFFDIEHPYITKDKMMSLENKFSFLSKMTYEDVMYYRFRYYVGLQAIKPAWLSEEDKPDLDSYFRDVKTGYWICKSELDEFGDPVGVSLSCPFYAKTIKDGNVDEESVEFFLNISANNIRFIPAPFHDFVFPFRKNVLTIKDASGNQLKCSLDGKLNITSNASSFLRFIEHEGIIKGSIAQEEGGVSYVFSLYANGYNAAIKDVNLSTSTITDLDKKNE